jgi:hypothetical protein
MAAFARSNYRGETGLATRSGLREFLSRDSGAHARYSVIVPIADTGAQQAGVPPTARWWVAATARLA